jgi:hypothetical protein
MDTIIRSEPDSQITQPWNKGKLTWSQAAPPSETCLGGENAPSIGKPS